MGSFYVNYSVKAPADKVAGYLKQQKILAFVGSNVNGWCCFADETSEWQDINEIVKLGIAVSQALGTTLSAMNHDDDILELRLFEAGEQVALFNSCPDYFDDDVGDEDPVPLFENVENLAALNPGLSSEELIESLSADEDFAMDVHARSYALLGLPAYSMGFGYNYASQGQLSVVPDELVKTP